MTIKLLETNIRLRPSSVESFYNCSYQWGKQFLEGIKSIPNSRAAIGTAIHKAAEVLWTDAIKTNSIDTNKSKLNDAALECYKEEEKKGIVYDDTEDTNSSQLEILKGIGAYVEDIVPFASIPTYVEKFYKIQVNNPIVAEIGGTIDNITGNTIVDIKTSKRKKGTEGYKVQQSLYNILANKNGHKITNNLIHQVVLKKQPEGAIQALEQNEAQAKTLINGILDTMSIVAEDKYPIENILRPNPGHIFCSQKYCNFYGKCPATKNL